MLKSQNKNNHDIQNNDLLQNQIEDIDYLIENQNKKL